MGTKARPAVRKNGAEMTKHDQLPARPAPPSKRPVRVKLKRVDCDYHIPYAPESMKRDWLARLKKALGTASPDFVAATLRQVEIASRLPYQGTSESPSTWRSPPSRVRSQGMRSKPSPPFSSPAPTRPPCTS